MNISKKTIAKKMRYKNIIFNQILHCQKIIFKSEFKPRQRYHDT